jgi:myo-inositol-1-phosphate synthase
MTINTNAGDIRVAIVGVGNCANSLVQGVEYYKDAKPDQEIPGLMHAVVGGYHINNVKFVAAYDVDAKKVGLDLSDAIWASGEQHNQVLQCTKVGCNR